MLNDIRFSKHATLGFFQQLPTNLPATIKTAAFTLGFLVKVAEKRKAAGQLTEQESSVLNDVNSALKSAGTIAKLLREETKVAAALSGDNLHTLIDYTAKTGAAKLAAPDIAELLKALMGAGGEQGGAMATQLGAPGGGVPVQTGTAMAENTPGLAEMMQGAQQGGGGGGGDAAAAMAAGGGGGEGAHGGLMDFLGKTEMPDIMGMLQHHPELAALLAGGAGLGGGALLGAKMRKKGSENIVKEAAIGEVANGTDGTSTRFTRALDYLGVSPDVARFVAGGNAGGMSAGVLSLLAA